MTQAPEITFDPEAHVYRLNGEALPSVTGIIRDAGLSDYSSIPPAILERAAARGKAVHTAIELLLENDLDFDSLDPSLHGYVAAYKRFVDDTGWTPTHVEQRVYHPVLRYVGTYDQLGAMRDGRRFLVDVKTAAKRAPWWPIQAAAYHECLDEPAGRAALRLDKHGRYEFIEYTDRNDRAVWIAAVTLHHWRKANG